MSGDPVGGEQPKDAQIDEEWFDIVDQFDEVIGRAPRSEVHARGLLHRAIHVWVFNSEGHLLTHLRTAQKVEEPLKWTSSACGHVSSGEDYLTSAIRELNEELGITADLLEMHKIPSGPRTGYEHTTLFRCVSDDTPIPDPEEIAEYRYISLETAYAWLNDRPDQLTNPFREFLYWARDTGFDAASC